MELWLESLLVALHTIRGNRLRSFLTSLTVAIGAASMTLLVSLADSALTTITDGVDAVGGRDLIFLEPKKPKQATAQPITALTPEDVSALRTRVPGLSEISFLMSFRNQDMLGNGKKTDVDVAIGEVYPRLLLQELEVGSSIPPESSERVVVLSKAVAQKLFGSPQAALSQSVLLWGKRYQVVGVSKDLAKFGFNMGGVSKQRAVFVATNCAIRTEGFTPAGMIALRTEASADHELQMSIASAILAFRHRGVDDFEFFDFRAFLSKFEKVFFALRIIVALIAGVSLLIAGAGIMNVMMASVRGRVAEIGVRRAIGAGPNDIRRQFVTEAVLIAGLGGLFGTLFGSGLSLVLGAVLTQITSSWINRVPLEAPLCALVSSLLIGVVFGIRPAQRASGLNVVACLRGETA